MNTSKEQEKGKCEYCKNHGHNFCPAPPKREEEKVCEHCKGNIAIRNPKGFCDHLHYPEACEVCSAPPKEEQPREWVKEFLSMKITDYGEMGSYKTKAVNDVLGEAQISEIESFISTIESEAYKKGEQLGRTSTCKWAKEGWIPDARREVVDTILKIVEGEKKEHKVFECTQRNYEDWCDIKICPNAKKERSCNEALSSLATKIRERYIDKSL